MTQACWAFDAAADGLKLAFAHPDAVKGRLW